MTTRPLIACAIAALATTTALASPALASPDSAERDTRFVTVDFSDHYNVNRNGTQIINARTFPSGDVMSTSGIPYAFGPDHGLFAWSAEKVKGPNPRVLEIDTQLDGAVRVYTLIGTAWGSDREGLLAIEFLGDQGAFHRVDLVGNHLVRDHNHNRHATNRLSADNAREVWDNHRGQRLDRQRFDLPETFRDERLAQIRVVDTGQDKLSRGIVFAITAEVFDPDAARAEALSLIEQERASRLIERERESRASSRPAATDAEQPVDARELISDLRAQRAATRRH